MSSGFAKVEQFTVSEMEQIPDMVMFNITTDKEEIILDCQSFLNGLKLTESNQFYFLDESECYYTKMEISRILENKMKPVLYFDFDQKKFAVDIAD